MCLEKGLIQSIKVKSNKTHLTIAFFHDLGSGYDTKIKSKS